jgi:hypothetical protein
MPRPNYSATTASHLPTVSYVAVDGTIMDAKVMGLGASTNQLNLRVPHLGGANRNKTNVDRRTAIGQTNRWF